MGLDFFGVILYHNRKGGENVKIQVTSYGVTIWTDDGKTYTAATEEEARELMQQDEAND